MTIDWNAIATAVIAGIVLGILSAAYMTAKRLATWFVRRAARHLPIQVRETQADEWVAEVCVSSRRHALRFGFRLWVSAGTIARAVEAATVERGDETEAIMARLEVEIDKLLRNTPPPTGWMENNTQNVANEITRRAWDSRTHHAFYQMTQPRAAWLTDPSDVAVPPAASPVGPSDQARD